MASYLQQCYDLYIQDFPDSWIDSVNDNSDMKALFDKINIFIEQGFILLSKSAISGEYIKLPDLDSIIYDFTQSTSCEINPAFIPGSNQFNIAKNFKDLNEALANALRHYQALVEYAKNKFDTLSQENRYSSFRTKNNSEILLNQFNIFTFALCRWDYHLPTNEPDFYDLLHLSSELKVLIGKSNKKLREIYSILLQKCNFIIRRIKSEPFDFSLDFVMENINPADLEIGTLDIFLEDSTLLDFDENEHIESIKKGNSKLKDYVFLMRFYKKNHTQDAVIQKMNFVIDSFEKYFCKIEKTQSYKIPKLLIDKCDKFAINSVYNYIFNCRFSYLSQHGNLSIKEIQSNLRTIEDIQQKTGVINFHPYEKAINAIDLSINSHLKKDSFDDGLIQNMLDELDRLIKKYNTAIIWSKSHKFFPFQLTFDESICTDENGIQIFAPSANATVIDYKVQDLHLATIKQKRELLDYYFEVAKDRKEIEEHKTSIEKIKDNIKSSEKKSYELVGLFAALITFLFGTINIFTASNTSLPQLLVNTSGLGIILLLFLSVFVSTSPFFVEKDLNLTEYFKTKRFYIPFVLVLIHACLIIFLTFNLKDNQNKIHASNTKLNVIKSHVNDSLATDGKYKVKGVKKQVSTTD